MTEQIRFSTKLGNSLGHFLQAIGAITLAAMMFLGAADVILRYFFNSPIAGTYELVEYMMAVIVPFGLCICAHQQAHICVDILTGRLSAKPKAVLAFMGDLLATFLAVLIAWRCYFYIGEEYESQLTSSVLFIPVYPFVALVFVALASLSLIWLINLLDRFREMVEAWSQ